MTLRKGEHGTKGPGWDGAASAHDTKLPIPFYGAIIGIVMLLTGAPALKALGVIVLPYASVG